MDNRVTDRYTLGYLLYTVTYSDLRTDHISYTVTDNDLRIDHITKPHHREAWKACGTVGGAAGADLR